MWAFAMTSAIAVFEATGSALAVGVAGAALYLPQLVLAPVSGSWTDRGDPKRQVVLGTSITFVASLAMTSWVVVAQPEGWGFVAAVVTCSALVGSGMILSSPGQQAVLPRMVTHEELPTAMGLNFAPMTVARIAGPVAGASLLAMSGPALGFGFTAGCQLIATLCFLAMVLPPVESQQSEADHSVVSAFKYLFADRPLLIMMIVAVATSFGAEPSLTLAPALGEEFSTGTGFVGLLSATFGVGAALGLASGRVMGDRNWTHYGPFIALGLQTVGLIMSSLSPSIGLALLGFGLTGVGFSVAVTTMGTGIMLRLPPALRGRIMSFWIMSSLGFRPIASLLVGLVSDLVSVRIAIVAMAVITGLVMILALPRRLAQAPPE